MFILVSPEGSRQARIISIVIFSYKRRSEFTLLRVTWSRSVRYFAHRRAAPARHAIYQEKHMKTTKYLPAIVIVAAALMSPAAFADNADFRFSIGDVSFGVGIGTPPPAPIVEYVPVAVPGHVWAPGFWAWNGHRHVWNSGSWQRARAGYSHVAGHWEQRGERWHFEPSRWEAHRTVGHDTGKHTYASHSRHEGYRDHVSYRDGYSRHDYSR
jgi:hypothetical protein